MHKLKKHLVDSIQKSSSTSSASNFSKEAFQFKPLWSALKVGLKNKTTNAVKGLEKLDRNLGRKIWKMTGNGESSIGRGVRKFFSYHDMTYPHVNGKEVVREVSGALRRVPSLLGGAKNTSAIAGSILLSNKLVSNSASKQRDNDLSALAPPPKPSNLDFVKQPVGKLVHGNSPTRDYNHKVVSTLEKLKLSDKDKYQQTIDSMPEPIRNRYFEYRNKFLGA